MRTGKIARLPHFIREELNRRMQLGEPGVETVRWLNSEIRVRAVLLAEFEGRPISEQNLSEWRHGGFLEWQIRRDIFHDFTATAADEASFAVAGASSEAMLRVLALHYAAALNDWTATQSHAAADKMRCIKEFSEYAFALSRHEMRCARLRLDQERLELARAKHQSRQQRAENPAPPAKSPAAAPTPKPAAPVPAAPAFSSLDQPVFLTPSDCPEQNRPPFHNGPPEPPIFPSAFLEPGELGELGESNQNQTESNLI